MASQWAGSIPPPAGLEPNIINPPSQLPNNIALHTVCLGLVTLFVAMRLYTRVAINQARLWLDDYFCLISWAFTVAFSSLMIKSYTLGIGRHMWDEPPLWLIDALKWFTIAEFTYMLLTGCIKLAFLFFFYRLFSPQPKVKMWIIGGIILVTCLNLAIFFATVFECSPIAKNWNASLSGHCDNPVILPYLSGSTSSATDIFILVLPVQPLWSLNMTLARRLRILAVFGLGSFACVASLVRLGMTPILQSSEDVTWNLSRMGVWATIEVNIGIICSCLGLLPAFLDCHLPDAIKSSAARLWSRTVQSLSFSKRSANASGLHVPSRDRNPQWATYQQKLDSESQHHITMNEIPTTVYQGP